MKVLPGIAYSAYSFVLNHLSVSTVFELDVKRSDLVASFKISLYLKVM